MWAGGLRYVLGVPHLHINRPSVPEWAFEGGQKHYTKAQETHCARTKRVMSLDGRHTPKRFLLPSGAVLHHMTDHLQRCAVYGEIFLRLVSRRKSGTKPEYVLPKRQNGVLYKNESHVVWIRYRVI